MQKASKNRLIKLLLLGGLLCLGMGLILYGASDVLTFFYTPSTVPTNKTIVRVGGVVKENSIKHRGLNEIEFIITDQTNELNVKYQGLLPRLFREKQQVLVKGRIINNIILANQILSKHDENYLPAMQKSNMINR